MMEVFTSYYSSPPGLLQIQCSNKHVLSVLFTENTTQIESEDNECIRNCKLQLNEYFSGTRKQFDLPLDQQGTDFQQKVWDLLYKIPYGKTISYNELAKKYGDVKSIRAVAAANGKNKLAIIVPCHRVIGSNQSLTGYAGGLWRKKWLLDHEARYHSGLQQFNF
jgi:methylated-DNA-[protein]-cysteine S-methyltransferase